MMQTPAIVPTSAAHWQPALLREGELVEGIHDIDQAIRIILSTLEPTPTARPSAAASTTTSTGPSPAPARTSCVKSSLH